MNHNAIPLRESEAQQALKRIKEAAAAPGVALPPPDESCELNIFPDVVNASWLSVCVITHVGDFGYLKSLVGSLPPGCELVLLVNQPGNDNVPILQDEVLLDGCDVRLKLYKYEYKEFSFAALKNVAISLASGEWVLCLDSDEIFVWTADALNAVQKLPMQYGGLRLDSHSKATNPTSDRIERWTAPQTRLFRNKKGFKFQRRIHEDITQSILQKGYKIGEITLDIIHSGYYSKNKQESIEKITAKSLRNYELMIDELAQNKSELQMMEYLRNTLNQLSTLGVIPKQEGIYAN